MKKLQDAGGITTPRSRWSLKKIVMIALATFSILRFASALATTCEDPNGSNCTWRAESGPSWTDVTIGDSYIRLYWPYFGIGEAFPTE